MFAGGFPQIACRGGRSVDVALASYVAAAAANGGTVSAGRQTPVRTLINASMDLDHWWNTDDMALMAAEDAGSALTLLKSGRKMLPVNSPTFTVDRDYACDGLSSYVDTNYPLSLATQMRTGHYRIGNYERVNLAAAATSIGISETGIGVLSMRNRSASTTMLSNLISTTATFTIVADSRGLKVVSRINSAASVSGWERGVALTPIAVTSNGTAVPTIALFIGARNTDGAANQFRAGSFAWGEWGAPLPGGTASELAWYNALQTFMTAIGANV
ncbi:hypothetical protein BH10PSE6_BH10PSE6_16790 [soil metagenome]